MRLEYYRLQKISEGSIRLQDDDARPLDGPTEVGSGLVRPQPVSLSQLIDLVNEPPSRSSLLCIDPKAFFPAYVVAISW